MFFWNIFKANMCPYSESKDVYQLWLGRLDSVTHHMDAFYWLLGCVCVCVYARKQWSKQSWYPATVAHDHFNDKLVCAAGWGEIRPCLHSFIRSKTLNQMEWAAPDITTRIHMQRNVSVFQECFSDCKVWLSLHPQSDELQLNFSSYQVWKIHWGPKVWVLYQHLFVFIMHKLTQKLVCHSVDAACSTMNYLYLIQIKNFKSLRCFFSNWNISECKDFLSLLSHHKLTANTRHWLIWSSMSYLLCWWWFNFEKDFH